MKYIKLFEQAIDEPKIGYYVKINSNTFTDLKDFFDNEIGKIYEINSNDKSFPYCVNFENKIPGSTYGPADNRMAFGIKELLAWAPDEESLKIAIDAKKYNI